MHAGNRLFDALLALAVVGLTACGWWLANRPVAAPDWPARVAGLAYSPALAGQDAARGELPDEAVLAADVTLLAGRAGRLRTYSLEGALARLPALAARAGLGVTPGVWLDGDDRGDAARLERLARVAAGAPEVTEVVVGNETVLRGVLEPAALAARLERARALTGLAVSTAEPWHVWLEHPGLAAHVDFLTVHVLPYWEGIAVEDAPAWVLDRLAAVRAAFPGRRVVLGEVGWPTRGPVRGAARPSTANAALFARRFLALAGPAGVEYYLMEAIDQPWKRADEGEAGAHWGILDVRRRPKLAERGPVVPEPRWPVAAAASALVALALLALLLVDGASLGRRGRAFLAAVAVAAGSGVTWLALQEAGRYWTAAAAASTAILAAGVAIAVLLALAEAHEWAEARWGRRRRTVRARGAGAAPRLPVVSVHVAVHDEPPALVCATLDALAALDYPDFEVLVIDNNSPHARTWRPVEAHCARLGARFRFVRVARLPGYKAGALNLALSLTRDDAEVVGVVDADYQVEPAWLRDLAGAFADPALGVVQAPQDYRDGAEHPFKAACEAEYRGFFAIGMPTRNDRNAIIQHGTMTLVRREALASAGGWAEWTVTEDAELGLRLLERGWETLYVPRSYGRGVTPDSFLDYRRQRARWALGAMQILRGHAHAILGRRRTALRAGQRYHFVAGWLPWIADGLAALFALAALGWSLAMLAAPEHVGPPRIGFALVPVAVFALRIVKVAHLYRACVGASWADTARAALAGLALAPAAGLAALGGLAGRRIPFARTPKHAPPPRLAASLRAVRWECAAGAALLGAVLALGLDPAVQPGPGLDAWRVALAVLAAPHVAAVLVAVRAATGRRRRPTPGPAGALADGSR